MRAFVFSLLLMSSLMEEAMANLPGRRYPSLTYPLVLHRDPPISPDLSASHSVVSAGGSLNTKRVDDGNKIKEDLSSLYDIIGVQDTVTIAINSTELPMINSTEKETENVLEKEVKETTDEDDNAMKTLKKRKRLFRRKKTLDKSGSALGIAKKLKNRNSLNIKRKLVHVIFGAGFASLNHALPRKYFLPFMYTINAGSIFVESFRYRKGFGWMNKAMHAVLGSSLRKHEMEGKFTGSLYYFTGVTTSSYFFPKTATTLGIFQLALADPAASYFGRKTRDVYWSRIENGLFGIGRNKGLLGFVGGALVCFPLNYRVLSIAKWGAEGVPGGKTALILASLALGAAGSFADLAVPTPAVTLPSKWCGIPLPPLSIDDNFVVPVFSGYACMKLFDRLGWSQGLELSKYIIF